MAKQESPLQALAAYLPEGSFPMVERYLLDHHVHLTITRSRSTLLGDYRPAHRGRNHRISVNGDMNRYAFLITLLHELAHLLTFLKHGNTVAAHGREWKSMFGSILAKFISVDIFPGPIRSALAASLDNPAASSCADVELMRVLRTYDPIRPGKCLVEDLLPGARFRIAGGRVFRRGDVQRKRIRCIEEPSGRIYLFSPVYEVEKLEL
jgi:hypothetical protein